MAPFISFLFSFFSRSWRSFPSQILVPCQRILSWLDILTPQSAGCGCTVWTLPQHILCETRVSRFSGRIVCTCAILCTQELLRALESDLGISRHLCNVRHVVESSRFYSIHPSAPTVEVQQKCWIGLWKAHCAHGVYIVNIHWIAMNCPLWIYIAVTSGVPRSRSRHTKFSDKRLRCTRSQQLFSVAQFGMCCPPTVLGRKAAFETPKWNRYLQVRWNQLHATTMQMTRGKVSKNPCHSSIQSFDLDT